MEQDQGQVVPFLAEHEATSPVHMRTAHIIGQVVPCPHVYFITYTGTYQ
jgi:hypothetical protein